MSRKNSLSRKRPTAGSPRSANSANDSPDETTLTIEPGVQTTSGTTTKTATAATAATATLALRLSLYAVFPVLFALAGAAFVKLEVGAIYLWDFATYWSQVLQLSNFLKQGGTLWTVLKTTYHSSATQDYNLLPSLPLVPFQFLGFDPRTGYIVGICFLYAGLLYLVCCDLSHQQFEATSARKWMTPVAGAAVMFASATLWWPIYRGFVDVIALACSLAGVGFAIRAERGNLRTLFYYLSGVFLTLAPVLRRSYSFFLLSFVLLFTVLLCLGLLRTKVSWKTALQNLRAPAFLAVGILSVFAVFPGFFIRSIKMDHAVHSSYKTWSSGLDEYLYLCGWFGVMPILAAGVGVWVIARANRLKGAVAAGAGASLLGAVLQIRTASLGEHHRYILVAGFLIVMATALGISLSRKDRVSSKVFLLFSAITIFGTIADLHGAGSPGDWYPLPGENPYAMEKRRRPLWWLVTFGFAGPKPIVRNDTTELQRLYAYLDRTCANDPNPRVYILASGPVLSNGVILSSLLAPPGLKITCLNRFLPVHEVDSRDGVPNNILQATHVLTTYPIELHLPVASHKCVTTPWEQFRDNRGIARAFERIPEEFQLENGVKAVVYRRTRLLTKDDVGELETDLRKSGLIPQ